MTPTGRRWQTIIWMIDERAAADLALARDDGARAATRARWSGFRDEAVAASERGAPLTERRMVSNLKTALRQTNRGLLQTLRQVRVADAEREAAIDALAKRTQAATGKRVERSQDRRTRAQKLRAEHRSIAQIALDLKVQPRTVERYFADEKVPTGRRPVRQDDEIPG